MAELRQWTIVAALGLSGFFAACLSDSPVGDFPIAPSVRILSPANNTDVVERVFVEIHATDDVEVTRVEIYIDDNLDSTRVLIRPPFQYVWYTSELVEGSVHTIRVKAYDGDNHVTDSEPISVTIRRFPAPTDLTITAVAESSASLRWRESNTIETGYEIEAHAGGGDFLTLRVVEPDIVSATVSGIDLRNNIYYFRVRAVGATFRSGYSNIASTELASPTELATTSVGEQSIGLRWQEENSFESGFEVEQSANGVQYSPVKLVGTNTKRTSVTGSFIVGETYYFRVRAVSSVGKSRPSAPVTVSLTFPPPTSLAVTAAKENQIDLTWEDHSDFETGFNIEHSTDNVQFTVLHQVGANSTSASVTGLTDRGVNHYLRVKARTDINVSEPTAAVKIFYHDELIAGGQFTIAGEASAPRIVRWNGQNWLPLASGVGGSGTPVIHTLAVFGNELYLGGSFTIADGVASNHVAKWDGTGLSSVGTGMNNMVLSMATMGNELFAGGRFTIAGGSTAQGIGKWNGSDWSALGEGVDGYVQALRSFNGSLYVGGSFTSAGSVSAQSVAKWDGSTWSQLGDGVDGAVQDVCTYGGELYAGGFFHSSGTVDLGHVGKWNGSSWSSTGGGANAFVEVLTVFDGKLIAGGGFTSIGGEGANYVASFNGSSWSPMGLGMNGPVFALMVYKNELYAGGSFTLADGSPAKNIAKWNGSRWIEVGGGTNEAVRVLEVFGHWLWEPVL